MTSKYDWSQPGNIIIYGESATGKTTFIKYLLDLAVKSEKYTIDDIHVFTTSRYQWEAGYPHIYEDAEDLPRAQCAIINSKRQGIIVFDDFNNKINTNSSQYGDLYTRGRHVGIRVMAVAHRPKSIGKDARSSIRYAMTTFTNNVEFVHELSQMYYGGNVIELKRHLNEVNKTPFQILVTDKRNGKIWIDSAPLKQTLQEASTEDVALPNMGATQDYTADRTGNFKQNFGASKNIRQGDNSMFYDKSKTQNVYNIDNKVELRQILLKNKVNNYMKRVNQAEEQARIVKQQEFDKKQAFQTAKEELYKLCTKHYKTNQDITRQIELLKYFCQYNGIDYGNMETYSTEFMRHYYGDTEYAGRDKKIVDTVNALPIVESALAGNYVPAFRAALEKWF